MLWLMLVYSNKKILHYELSSIKKNVSIWWAFKIFDGLLKAFEIF